LYLLDASVGAGIRDADVTRDGDVVGSVVVGFCVGVADISGIEDWKEVKSEGTTFFDL